MPSLPSRVLRRGRAGAALLRQGPRPVVARRLVDAGLVDRAWYAAQSGETCDTDRAAAVHYLRVGRRAGWSLHPLLEPEWILPPTWRTARLDPVQLYLAGRTARGGPSPVFDDATYLGQEPGAAGDPGGPLGHYLRHHDADAALPTATGEPLTLTDLRRRLDDATAPPPGPRRETAGLTSVVVRLDDEWPATIALVDGAFIGSPFIGSPFNGGASGGPASVGTGAVEVVLVQRESRPAVHRLLRARYGGDARVRWVRLPAGSSTQEVWAAGLAAATGDVAILVSAACTVRTSGMPLGQPWWVPLRAALDDDAVSAAGPLVLGPTGTVASAGYDVAGLSGSAGAYRARLVDEAPEHAVTLGPQDVASLDPEPLAARTADLRAALAESKTGALVQQLAGLARERGSAGRLVLRPDVRLIRETGAPAPAPAPARAAPAGERPLRWAIKIAAPSSEQGDKWGDVHFAADLAAALERLGQHVGVDRKPAHDRSTVGLDDVVLNLRGLATPRLRPEQVNVLWVISHPDQVEPPELRAYDLRFAASIPWARRMSEQAQVPVRPLLQATDPARFRPEVAEPDTGPPVLFVGNSRGVVRPIVRDALAAGCDLSVYGTRWKDFIGAEHVLGMYLPNETVGAAYRAAGVVLNDHWPDMAAQGFVSNRVFDVVAAGGRVISDPVDGLAELFEGAALEYRTPADLARWTGPDRDTSFPTPQRLLEISARVRAEHSFDARAAELLAAVREVLAGRRSGPGGSAGSADSGA